MNENQNKYVDINAHDNYPDSKQKIEIPTMKVIPLKKICMTIGELPTSYLETMTYYEMLIWFINYLRDNIIPTVNNNASAVQEVQTVVMSLQNYINSYKDSIDSDVEELEEYMNDYFENLDVQEEINNKLDDMLKDGVLEQIIEQFIHSTAVWCFDNVSDMKSATNLVNGSFCKTLGYHTINDDGEASYKITDTLPQNELYETLNNGLYAVLIIEDRLNIKQIGAYGDGEHEDSTYFQTAINYLANIINSSDIANKNTIIIPAGKYKISNKIVLSPFVKLRTKGFVALLSYVDNGSTIHICPSANDLQHSIGDRQDWFRGPIIEGNSGLIIKYMGQDNSNAIAIEIGLNKNLEKGVARFSIQEFRIQGFNIGILFNRFHVYLGEMRRISFENNTIGVQYSPDVATEPVDSGERITYNECIFARNNIAVKWLCGGFDSNFTNTSFDFVPCVFYDPNNKGYRYINVVQCHFEGIGINNKEDATIPSGIVYGQMRSGRINIISSDVYLTYEDYLFYCNPSLQANYILSFSFNKLVYPKGQNKKGNYFLATDNINILDINNSNGFDDYAKFLQLKKMIYYYDFSDMQLGEFTFDNTTKRIGKFIAPTKNSEISDTMNIVSSPFGKALQLTKTSNTINYFRLNTELFPVIGGRSVIVNVCKNIISTTFISFKYYDQNKELIGQTGDYHYESNEKDGDLYMSDWVKRLYVPSNAYYLEVLWSNVIPADVSNLTIYGLFVQYE